MIIIAVKYIDWDNEKNKKLKDERGISFEDIYILIQEDKILEIIDHPNHKQYPNQKIILVVIDDYIYMVPFVEDEGKYFLKTIIPSRKMTKNYLKKRGGENL
ncbi:MAG: BrnT family toxin [Patescibacteria group bacterium]